jgi:hypothetical protein
MSAIHIDHRSPDSEPTTPGLNISCNVPLRHEVDVFVAGGGPAGTAAALAAARLGATVFLAEAEICFGGVSTAAALPMLVSFGDGIDFHAGGIGREIYDRLRASGGCVNPPLCKDCDLYFEPEVLKIIFDEMICAEKRIIPSLATQVLGIDHAEGRVRHVICQGKSGLFAVRAGCVIDCTGDADLCAWAGAPFKKGDPKGRMQPATLVSIWAGIDWERAQAAGQGLWQQSARIKDAIADGIFSVPDPGMPGIVPTGVDTGNGNVGHLFGIDGSDERSITQYAMAARRRLGEYGRYFREYLTGYERIHLCGTPARIGIRETRRIVGDYELTLDDYQGQAVFDDEIGRFAYPVDLHPTTLDETEECHAIFEKVRLAPGETYGIPLRCLHPQGLHNVIAAGRCVSADRPTLGSLRVQPGCYITGQAAGVNAVLALRGDGTMRGVGHRPVQRELLALGAWLPNAQP